VLNTGLTLGAGFSEAGVGVGAVVEVLLWMLESDVERF